MRVATADVIGIARMTAKAPKSSPTTDTVVSGHGIACRSRAKLCAPHRTAF
jgi:hypothetical protein